jgi:hypothetical protein
MFAILFSLSLVYSAPLICNTNQPVDPPSINQGGDNTPYAIFFSEKEFKGDQFGIRPGETIFHGLEPKLKKSIRISPHHEMVLFEKTEFGGSSFLVQESVPDVEGSLIGFVPESFWYRLTTTDPSVFPRIYAKTSFEGEPLVIPFGLTDLPDPKIFGSMKIPVGVTVKLTTVYGPKLLTRDIFLDSDSDNLPFTEPVTSVFVSVDPVEL